MRAIFACISMYNRSMKKNYAFQCSGSAIANILNQWAKSRLRPCSGSPVCRSKHAKK